MHPVLDLITFKIVEVPGIRAITSWLEVRHADNSANEVILIGIQFQIDSKHGCSGIQEFMDDINKPTFLKTNVVGLV